jgi:hypothetical protein
VRPQHVCCSIMTLLSINGGGTFPTVAACARPRAGDGATWSSMAMALGSLDTLLRRHAASTSWGGFPPGRSRAGRTRATPGFAVAKHAGASASAVGRPCWQHVGLELRIVSAEGTRRCYYFLP